MSFQFSDYFHSTYRSAIPNELGIALIAAQNHHTSLIVWARSTEQGPEIHADLRSLLRVRKSEEDLLQGITAAEDLLYECVNLKRLGTADARGCVAEVLMGLAMLLHVTKWFAEHQDGVTQQLDALYKFCLDEIPSNHLPRLQARFSRIIQIIQELAEMNPLYYRSLTTTIKHLLATFPDPTPDQAQTILSLFPLLPLKHAGEDIIKWWVDYLKAKVKAGDRMDDGTWLEGAIKHAIKGDYGSAIPDAHSVPIHRLNLVDSTDGPSLKPVWPMFRDDASGLLFLHPRLDDLATRSPKTNLSKASNKARKNLEHARDSGFDHSFNGCDLAFTRFGGVCLWWIPGDAYKKMPGGDGFWGNVMVAIEICPEEHTTDERRLPSFKMLDPKAQDMLINVALHYTAIFSEHYETEETPPDDTAIARTLRHSQAEDHTLYDETYGPLILTFKPNESDNMFYAIDKDIRPNRHSMYKWSFQATYSKPRS